MITTKALGDTAQCSIHSTSTFNNCIMENIQNLLDRYWSYCFIHKTSALNTGFIGQYLIFSDTAKSTVRGYSIIAILDITQYFVQDTGDTDQYTVF